MVQVSVIKSITNELHSTDIIFHVKSPYTDVNDDSRSDKQQSQSRKP